MFEYMKLLKKLLVIIIIIIGVFLYNKEVNAASTIYVNSSTGSDTGDGSLGSPYKTFYKAYTESVSGDTINLTGTFTWTDADESGDVISSGYILEKDLTIVGQGTDETIIQAHESPNTADRSVFTINEFLAEIAFEDLTIRNGVASAEGSGGGLSIAGYVTLTITNVRLTANYYNSTNVRGAGAIYADTNSYLYIYQSTIDDNHFNGVTAGSAGIYMYQNVDLEILNSTFTNNEAVCSDPDSHMAAGALYTYRFGSAEITNSTFANNHTNSFPGVMYIYYRDWVDITNCTIVNNTAGRLAGGIYYTSLDSSLDINFKNSIIADNTAGGSPNDVYITDGTPSGALKTYGYNIVEYSEGMIFDGTGDITGNQENLNIAGELADNLTLNGTQTLALLEDSIAINAGDPDNIKNDRIDIPTEDQRGSSRNGVTDIGAYEYGGTFSAEHTLTYTASEHGSIDGTTPQTVSHGEDGTTVTAVPDTGCSFNSWSDGVETAERTDSSVTEDISVTANFNINQYTLTYSAGENGSISGSTSQTVDYGSDGSLVEAIPDDSYKFIEWSDGSTENPRIDENVTSNLNISAVFDLDTYTIENIPDGLELEAIESEYDLEEGIPYGTETIIRIKNEEGEVIADVVVTFDQNIDWSEISAGIDINSGKSFVHGLDNEFFIYIPAVSGRDSILICPNATSLSDINSECTGGYFLSVNSEDVESVTINNVGYWKVSNLTGTGGMTYESDGLAESGRSMLIFIISGFLLLILFLFRFRDLGIKSDSKKENRIFYERI